MTRTVILLIILGVAASLLVGITAGRYLRYQRRTTTRRLDQAADREGWRIGYPRPDTGHGHVKPVRGEEQERELGHG
jgi:hypothetical protein